MLEKPVGSSQHPQDLIGRGVTSKIYAKEAILDSRLALKGAGGGLAAMIPPGMRAVAVAVNEVVGVAGFAVPGMHVDVIISGTPPVGPVAWDSDQDLAPEHRGVVRRAGL